MRSDVVDLRDFYESRLGQAAQRLIRSRIRKVWPNLSGQRLLGLGYATPYLRPFGTDAERVLAFMPAAQGVLRWPREGPGRVALVEETELPLADNSVDRVLLVHEIEGSEYLRALLREVWRVLDGNGRVLIVAPNRRGLWARFERTPWGWGLPYSRGQLSRLLRDNMFTPTQQESAIFIPPFKSRALLRSAPAWERIGQRWFPTFAGVVLTEASKQLYALSAKSEKRRLRRPVVLQLPQSASRSERNPLQE
jgi:SAM-dependent methyltransferase